MRKSFADYLAQKAMAESTIEGHLANLRRFQRWCYEQNLLTVKITHQDLLCYLDEQQARGLKAATLNLRLASLEHYYHYLRRADNPASGLRLKGVHQKALPELLSPEQLEQLLQAYLKRPARRFAKPYSALVHQRNTVLLSLLIYQGLHAGELSLLKVSDVDLGKGLLYVPSGKRWNSRKLRLQTVQVLLLETYLSQTREQLLEWKGLKTDKLLDVERRTDDQVRYLIGQIKAEKLAPAIPLQNARQIRVSVLMQWLKHYELRIAQHMIGHKYVSSTEHYQQQDLEDLQQQLAKYHPVQ